MLSDRQATILQHIVDEYVATATPVPSLAIAKKYGLNLSAATVRNEMAELEEGGFITHRHTSAGRIPSDRGYRHYVEEVSAHGELPIEVRRNIRSQFGLATMEVEEWGRLAASVLAQLVHNAALVTLPKAMDVRVRRIQLVELHASLAMLILVLREARVKQQMVSLTSPVEPRALEAASNRLNDLIAGAGPAEVERVRREADLSELEQQIVAAVLRSMQVLSTFGAADVNLAGLPEVLAQPEFSEGKRAHRMAEILGEPGAFAGVLADVLRDETFQVVIGGENQEGLLRECSLVLASYGLPGEMTGLIGLVGPTRMEYDRAIPGIRFLASLMTELVREVHG